eukprot:CAMPEP_0194370492 /NCGR_PEP_ID=MMETSP0174-20130528/18795_1 /TAXON_ID=216777 /ORGANISM="Proboscia alata, Strain PI-D3" /LENGTH=319 /DNA_ID=CAMNT_0039147987 /DNA_START=106 /DNA_END=1062 /DNA_ORIENTATION=+
MRKMDISGHLERLKESFLWAAAKGGRAQECSSLLELGADVNWKYSSDGETCLHHAARGGHKEVVELLLMYGADCSQLDNVGDSVLHITARRGDSELCAIFSSQVSPYLQNTCGKSSLDIAIENGHLTLCEQMEKVYNDQQERSSEDGNESFTSDEGLSNSGSAIENNSLESEVSLNTSHNESNHVNEEGSISDAEDFPSSAITRIYEVENVDEDGADWERSTENEDNDLNENNDTVGSKDSIQLKNLETKADNKGECNFERNLLDFDQVKHLSTKAITNLEALECRLKHILSLVVKEKEKRATAILVLEEEKRVCVICK